MNKRILRLLAPVRSLLTLSAATLILAGAQAQAQCPGTQLTSGLQFPLGITRSNQGNLLVSEIAGLPNMGRVTIVDPAGAKRTLLDGLPSGLNAMGDPSGPAGLFMSGRTLYVVIGEGDVVRPGPFPGTEVPNPAPPSSPIFSSVLAIHFSAHAEQTTAGFTLTPADQQALAAGQRVTLSNGGGDKITVELVANFPDFTPDPRPFFSGNVRHSNPFDLVVVGNQLYVTDGGQNLVWRADISTGAISVLAAFPPIPNPLPFGPPVVEAVPTGIAYSGGQLLVTLFRGFPFPPGTSQVVAVDPQTGAQAPFITGLSSAIDVLPVRSKGGTEYLVLEFSTNLLANQPGRLRRFRTPGGAPTVISNCLITPTSMTLDEKTGTLYVTELATGRIVAIQVK